MHFINELNCHFFLSLIRYFVRCNANYVNRARILIGSRSTNHVCQSFTRQIRAYLQEKVGEKDGENRDKFYMVANTFPTWLTTVAVSFTHANLSLSCEGRALETITMRSRCHRNRSQRLIFWLSMTTVKTKSPRWLPLSQRLLSLCIKGKP